MVNTISKYLILFIKVVNAYIYIYIFITPNSYLLHELDFLIEIFMVFLDSIKVTLKYIVYCDFVHERGIHIKIKYYRYAGVV